MSKRTELMGTVIIMVTWIAALSWVLASWSVWHDEMPVFTMRLVMALGGATIGIIVALVGVWILDRRG